MAAYEWVGGVAHKGALGGERHVLYRDGVLFAVYVHSSKVLELYTSELRISVRVHLPSLSQSGVTS